jgi:hypothetical protein
MDIISVLAIFAGGFGIIIYLSMKHERRKKEKIAKINIVLDDSLQISPQIKSSLKQFSIKNAYELRAMNPQELINLLSCSAKALEVFERRIERISDGYEQYEDLIMGSEIPLDLVNLVDSKSADRAIANNEKLHAPLKEKLDEQAQKAVAIFDVDLRAEGSVLNAIPEEYRHSFILNMMCGYLKSGEVDNWADCIKTFKTDAHRMQEMEAWQGFQGSIDRIEKRIGRIEFYSAMTMINTW